MADNVNGSQNNNSEQKPDRSRKRSRSGIRSRSHSGSHEWKRATRRGGFDRRTGKGDRRGDGRENEKVRLHIGNIPFDISWKELKDLIREKVVDDVGYVEIYEGPDGRSKGTGVVEMKGRELADKTIEQINKTEIKGRRIICRDEEPGDRPRARNRSPAPRSRMDSGRETRSEVPSLMDTGYNGGGVGGACNLQFLNQIGIDIANITNQVFVANLDYKVNVMKMEEVFTMAGNVIEVDLKSDKDGRSRGIATVRYEHPMEAVQAICLFNGQCLFDREMTVRMDRWVEPILQNIPRRNPVGLKSLGPGLGTGGQPVLNIGQIANTLTLSMLTGQLTPANALAGITSTNALSGINMGHLSGISGSNSLSTLGDVGMSNVSANDVTSLLKTISSKLSALGGTALSNLGGGTGSLADMMGGGGGSFGDLASDIGFTSGNQFGSGDSRGGGGRRGSPGPILRMGYEEEGRSSMGGRRGSLGFDDGDDNYRVNSFSSSGNKKENSSVFVKNLPFSFTWQNLVEKFRDSGEIKFAEILSENGRSRGCGVVEFHSPESARRAISTMNKVRFDGRQIEVRMDRLA